MLRRTFFIALTTLVMLAIAATPSAFAASADQIHQDAADGSIDGSYTLAEMRAADRAVSAEQREYFGWEDVYNAYVRTLANPDVVAPAVPVDRNRDGKIDEKEREAAEKITRAKCTKATPKAKRSKLCSEVIIDEDKQGDDAEAEPRDEENTAAKDEDEDSGTSPLLWLIVGIPLLVVALGAYRMRGRGKGTPKP